MHHNKFINVYFTIPLMTLLVGAYAFVVFGLLKTGDGYKVLRVKII